MRDFLIAGAAWGDCYINNLLKYCLPSLACSLPELRKTHHVTLSIRTDKKKFIQKSDIVQHIVDMGVHVVYPELDLNMASNKYLLLGILQRQDLIEAKRISADYHLLMPDFIYSKNCLFGIIEASKKGHKAICRLILSVSEEGILPELEKYRHGKKLSILGIDLVTLGLKNLHRGCKNWVARKDTYPDTHVQIYETQNTLRMHSPHMSPVYLAYEAIDIPTDYLPLDNQLDRITSYEWYCPAPEDCIGIIEISSAASRIEDTTRVSLEDFAKTFNTNTNNSKTQRELFFKETIDPLNPSMLQDREAWTLTDIMESQDKIREALTTNG